MSTENKLKVGVIIASTRPNRKGKIIADWFLNEIAKLPEFEPITLDLKEINLPMMDEPEHPRLRKYTHPHTFAWSELVDNCDAFVAITPEYNYSIPAALKNAFDYLSQEWNQKPMSFVSYGGISGGTRAVQELKLSVTTLEMMPLPQAVNIPFFSQYINEQGIFISNEKLQNSAHATLSSLLKWTKALKPMRAAK